MNTIQTHQFDENISLKIKRRAYLLGIDLGSQHWQVLTALSNYKRGSTSLFNPTEALQKMGKAIGVSRSDKALRNLFPDGPVSTGLQLLGYRVPSRFADQGFGSTL